MQNIDVRFVAHTNFAGAEAQLKALQARVEAFQASLAKAGTMGQTGMVDAKKWHNASNAVAAMSDAYRAAAASSGLLTASQLKVNSETERYTNLLQKQKISLREMIRNQSQMKKVYQDQLRMQRMTVTSVGIDKFGREISDITVPNQVSKELDTIGNKMKFIRTLTASASNEMINWGKNTQWAGRQLTVGLTMPMAAFAAYAGKVAYDVDKEMTRIAKVYDSTAGKEATVMQTNSELTKLRADSYALATKMAKQYGASINDVLSVEAELAATGLNGQKLLASTAETMRIATLGEVDVKTATNMTVALQSAFKDTIKTADDLSNAFNFMNAIENQTSLAIDDMAEAIPRAGAGLAALGVTVEQFGVMMVAMRENGIQAEEGANALKSASTRILNVVPEAQKKFDSFIKSQQTGYEGIQDIADKAGGNLYVFLQELAKVTQGMDPLAKQKGIAKLFGTYQYSRMNAALRGVTDAMFGFEGATTQAERAVQLMNMSQEDLASIAENEVARKMKSASGQFDSAWQQFRVSIAKVGEEFLPIGTEIIKILNGIIKAGSAIENALPGPMKSMVKWGLIITAIAGPAIMLAGLLANLIGWGMKLVGVGTKFNVLNRAQHAAKIQAEQTSTAYLREADSVRILTAEIQALAAAQGYATGVGTAALMGGPVTLGKNNSASGPVSLKGGYQGTPDAAGRMVWKDKAGKRVAGDSIPVIKRWKEEQALIAKHTKDTVKAVKAAGAATEDVDDASSKVKNNWMTAKTSTALMIAPLIASVAGAEQLAGHLMTASLAATAISAGRDVMFTRSNKAKAAGAAGEAALAAATDTRFGKTKAAIKGAGTSLASFGTKLKGVGMNILKFGKFWGPWGVAITGITLGLTWLYKKSKEAERQQEAINKSTDTWADVLGGVAEGYKKVQREQDKVNSKNMTPEEISEKLQKSKNGKEMVGAFKNAMGDDSRMDMLATQEFIKMLDKTNLTAEDAKIALEGMFLAAGMGAQKAGYEAQKYFDKLGDEIDGKRVDMREFSDMWQKQWSEAVTSPRTAMSENVDGIFKTFEDKIATASNSLERGEVLNEFLEPLQEELGASLNKAISDVNIDKSAFQEVGITGEQELASMVASWEKIVSEGHYGQPDAEAIKNFQKQFNIDDEEFRRLQQQLTMISNNSEVGKSLELYAKAIEELERILGIKLDILGIDQLIAGGTKDSWAMTAKQAEAEFNRIVDEKSKVGPITQQPIDGLREINNEEKLRILNQLRLKMGLKETTNLADMFLETTKGTVDWERKHKNKVLETNQALEARTQAYDDFVNGGAAEAQRSAMTNIVGHIADTRMQQIDRWQQSETDALEATLNAEEKAFDRREEHWDNYYDRLIDKTNAAYDRRIEKVERAIKAEESANETRKRIFEAEMTRMQRLADSANRNIDFNAALNSGNLDEAAKIMNDAQASTAKNQMESEMARADVLVQTRVASLEKQIDVLEKQRDAKVKALEIDRDAKEKAIQISRERWQAEADLRKKNLADSQAQTKQSYEQQLSLLRSFIPTSTEELMGYMRELDRRYGTFGGNLENKAGAWSKIIRDKHTSEMEIAANELKTNINWAGAGEAAAQGMLRGMAKAMGMSESEFSKWLGVEIAKDSERPSDPKPNNNRSVNRGGGNDPTLVAHHVGGRIGGNRLGFSGGQSQSEVPVLAQRGEYMIKKSSVNKYGTDFLDSVNDGRYGWGSPREGRGAGGTMIGTMAAMVAKGMMNTFSTGLGKAVSKKSSSMGFGMGGMMGAIGSAAAGRYGGTTFDAEQLRNAGIIASVGRSMGMSQRDIVIGLMTAMQESMLRNLNYGDRDSQGLFQQRPSQGWGTVEQVTNPQYASRKFFEGLKGVENRGSMSLTAAAQAVQRSAFPDAYAKWEDEARAIIATLAAGAGRSGGGFSGAGGGANATGQAAIRWATNLLGASGWSGLCQKFVRMALGAPGGYPTAISAWNGARLKHAGDWNPPAGVPVYFSPGSNGLGHSALHIGGGRVISTDWPYTDTIGYGTISGIAQKWNRQYLGWTGDINGKVVYPGLRTGGTIKYDNTLANLHRGETVLTSSLTRQFKENVASGGGNRYDMTIDLRGAVIEKDVDIKAAVKQAVREIENEKGRKRRVD